MRCPSLSGKGSDYWVSPILPLEPVRGIGDTLAMLRIIAKRTRYCDWFGKFWVNIISVAAFAATIHKTHPFKFGNKLSYFSSH